MQAECHTSTRVSDDALLDAARTCALTSGVRRTTLVAVARAAGVSRMTVYRRYPDVTTLLAALMTREFGRVLEGLAARAASGPHARATLVDTAVRAVLAVADDPLMRTVLDHDAGLLLPYLVERIGSTQRIAEHFLHERLLAGHADGSVRAGDAAAQARTLFLVAGSFVISLRPATSDVDRDTLVAELRAALDGALTPREDS